MFVVALSFVCWLMLRRHSSRRKSPVVFRITSRVAASYSASRSCSSSSSRRVILVVVVPLAVSLLLAVVPIVVRPLLIAPVDGVRGNTLFDRFEFVQILPAVTLRRDSVFLLFAFVVAVVVVGTGLVAAAALGTHHAAVATARDTAQHYVVLRIFVVSAVAVVHAVQRYLSCRKKWADTPSCAFRRRRRR